MKTSPLADHAITTVIKSTSTPLTIVFSNYPCRKHQGVGANPHAKNLLSNEVRSTFFFNISDQLRMNAKSRRKQKQSSTQADLRRAERCHHLRKNRDSNSSSESLDQLKKKAILSKKNRVKSLDKLIFLRTTPKGLHPRSRDRLATRHTQSTNYTESWHSEEDSSTKKRSSELFDKEAGSPSTSTTQWKGVKLIGCHWRTSIMSSDMDGHQWDRRVDKPEEVDNILQIRFFNRENPRTFAKEVIMSTSNQKSEIERCQTKMKKERFRKIAKSKEKLKSEQTPELGVKDTNPTSVE
ncbi:hypothetical protein CRE_06851 [Caenorhabditis remanei]|uniref:Uncharacterized protein n=1 Tax=Caenorhabditis remanei TaxID=31234 RepID=E3MZL3_CAERE|nr:hypothetical protein CRE_06851 [Caenorhabditis remanei]